MKKERRSNLDEMKEQQLLHIEKNGCWLAFWGLFIAMQVQFVMGKGFLSKELAGEWIVFMVLALYLAVACLRRGIWDRKLKPNFATNLILSLIAGVFVGVVIYVKAYYDFGKTQGALAAGFVAMICVFVLCLVVLCSLLQF